MNAPTNKPTVVRRIKSPCLRCRQPTSFIQTVGRNHVWACPAGHVNLVTPLPGIGSPVLYSSLEQRLASALTPEGQVADAEDFTAALRSLVGVVGHSASDVADSLVDAGMNEEAAAEVAFNLQSWT